MEIRILKQEEILDALHLTWEVFAESVAPLYSKEGVEEFQRTIRYDNIMSLYSRGEILFWGSFEAGVMTGCIAADPRGHIRLLFVKKEYQRRGTALQLVGSLKLYAAQALRVSILTVNAAPQAVGFYQKAGFCVTGAANTVHGITSVPMECLIRTASGVNVTEDMKRKRNRTIIIGTAVGAGVVVLAVMLLCAVLIAGRGYRQENHDSYYNHNDDYDYHDGYDHNIPDGNYDYEEEEPSGIENIDAYEADDLKYQTEDQTYQEKSGSQTSYIEFNVRYPKLTGLDSAQEEKINELIKQCAMKTVDEIYTHPSEDMKEKMLKSQNSALVSIVDYKITYQSNEFLSIVFNDECYKGTEYGGIELRSVNVNLKTGDTYEIKDIVDMNDSFMKVWLQSMKGEAPSAAFLDEVSLDDFYKVLKGDTFDGKYSNVFFVDDDGLEIGLSVMHQPEEQTEGAFYGWITAPFSFHEINTYKTDSAFWSLVNH